jgi:hypothetical protein
MNVFYNFYFCIYHFPLCNTNVLYTRTYRQYTTVILDVYLLVLRYMFRPILGHPGSLEVYYLVHCFSITLPLDLYYKLHCYKRSLILVLQATFWILGSLLWGKGVGFLPCGFLLLLWSCQISSRSTGEEEYHKRVIERRKPTPFPHKSTTEDPETSL